MKTVQTFKCPHCNGPLFIGNGELIEGVENVKSCDCKPTSTPSPSAKTKLFAWFEKMAWRLTPTYWRNRREMIKTFERGFEQARRAAALNVYRRH